MTSPAIMAAMTEACFGREAEERTHEDFDEFLRRHGVGAEDRAALSEAAPRFRLYRHLVRNNLRGVLHRMVPRTLAVFEALVPGRIEKDLGDFLAEAGPRSPYLRDVPQEFFSYVRPRWECDGTLPPYGVELAHFELLEFELLAAPEVPMPQEVGPLALDLPAVFHGPRRLAHYHYTVHQVPSAIEPHAVPENRPIHLYAYRDAAYQFRTLELTQAAAFLVEGLEAGLPLAESIRKTCETLKLPQDAAFLSGTAQVLADLGERGLLLGGARSLPADSSSHS